MQRVDKIYGAALQRSIPQIGARTVTYDSQPGVFLI
jgi:hypothetical protein